MVTEERLTRPDGLLVMPEELCGTGVLVLAGSSGRVDTERVRLLVWPALVTMLRLRE